MTTLRSAGTGVRAPSIKKALLTGLGALVAFFFMAPYIQMLITSLTPGS
jgi:hypothetical protein